MRLVFLHGLPGVGKLTVGRELSERTGYPLFHNHLTVDLVATLFPFGSREFVDFREHVWLEGFARAAGSGLPGLIFTFAAERTVPGGFPERVIEVVESRGGSVLFVEITCSAEELRRRVEAPDRKAFGKLSSADVLGELIADGTVTHLRPPPGAPRAAIDTTELSPAEAATRIAAALSEPPPRG